MKALRKNQKTMLGALALFLLSGGVAQAQVTVFTSPCDETYNSLTGKTQTDVPHRIPAIVETAKGELLVFADKRWGYGDIGQSNITGNTNGATSSQIDVRVKRSTDFGATWGAPEKVATGKTDDGFGDVAVVANRENPAEILAITGGGNVFITKATRDNKFKVRRFYSKDGGNNWIKMDANTEGDGYDEITDQIYNIMSYDGAFFSSGRILQSSKKYNNSNYYRLYAVLCTINQADELFGGTNNQFHRSVLVYSDDFGLTWKNAGVAIEHGDEAKAEELPNGNILIVAKSMSSNGVWGYYYSKTQAGRKFNIFTPNANGEGGTFASASGVQCDINEAIATNGEILIVPTNEDGQQVHYALMSMPSKDIDGERGNVGIYYKKLASAADYDEVSDFSNPEVWTFHQISYTTSAYSTMILQSNGKVGFAYEDVRSYGISGGSATVGYDIKYYSLSITDIIGEDKNAETIPNIDELFGEDESGNTKNTIAKKMNICSNNAHTQSAAAYSWASLYLPVSIQLPEGVTAYKVTGISDDQTVVDIEALSGQVVPAGEAVVLRDELKRAEIQLTLAAPQTASTDNLLKGCFVESINITSENRAQYFILGHSTNCEAFYNPADGYLKKWLAYLPLTQPQSATLMLRIKDGETTAIEQISLEQLQDNAPIFDLSGRRVQDATVPGIYIQGGKKFIVK